MAGSPTVIVVGAGIVGASIAWHLVAAGAEVTVVDAAEAGGVATARSFAWINASWGNPEYYFRLRVRSMAEWRRLAATVPGIPIAWVGGLCWDLPPDGLLAYAQEHSSWGYGVRQVGTAEAARNRAQSRHSAGPGPARRRRSGGGTRRRRPRDVAGRRSSGRPPVAWHGGA
jgi:glycine/D-amino acid oxidase-like deaminating enzyme